MEYIGNKQKRHTSKTAWIIVFIAALCCTIISLSSPSAYAQDNRSDSKQYFSAFQSVFNFILNNYVDEVDPKVLYEGAMKGMFEALKDPYSVFLDEAMLSDLSDTTTGKFGGIGLYINKRLPDPKSPEQRAYVDIVAPIEDTPGWRAGIMPGDQITHIDGESTEPLSSNEVLARLRGKPGSKVTITILRGTNLVFDEHITRAMIEVPTVKRAMLPNNIAYLRIIEFTPNTPPRVREAVSWFKTQNYSSLIIDLRNNPGGLLQSVEDTAELFLDGGVIVSTKSRTHKEDTVAKASGKPLVPSSVPIVVLINKGSASASEILAGALKDNKRAYLVGETTYGKGSVQQILPLGNTGFKLTMARYYTPSDANIDKTGIAPDREIKEPELSPKEEEALAKLFDENAFKNFAEKNPKAGSAQVDAFVKKLKQAGSPLSERILRKLTRNQLERTSIVPIYDLDYDLQLNAAIESIQAKNFAQLLSSALSVKELQDKAVKK